MNTKAIDKLNRDIKYVNKDFSEYRNSLINYAKTYFPDSYSDFNESSPGMMFIEMASYVGDVLSYYADVQLQESLLYTVQERKNLYNLGQSLGYKANTVTPALVDLEVFQVIPAIGQGDSTRPDYRYALVVESNMQVVSSEPPVAFFYTLDSIDFAYSSSIDPTTVSVYEVSNTGQVEKYLLKKSVRAISGDIQTSTFIFNEPKLYDKIALESRTATAIIDIVDSDGNRWYEVPYLAQDIVPMSVMNTNTTTPVLARYRDSAPYILHWKQTTEICY